MTKPFLYSEITKYEIIASSAFLLISFVVHALFIIDGIGEQDAGRMIHTALVWHVTGDANSTFFHTSPLYIHLLKKLLDWGMQVISLPIFINWLNVFIGTFTLIPMYLIWRQFLGPIVAGAGILLCSFSPAFWLSNIYGMAHLPSLAFFISALLLFVMALDSNGWKYVSTYIFAILFMMISCGLKVDIILCSGAFLGILLLNKKLTLRNTLSAAAIVSLGIIFSIVYSQSVAPTIGPSCSFFSSWNKTYPFTIHALLNFKHSLIIAAATGPGILFMATVSIFIFLFIKKDHRSLAIFSLLWCLPTVIFWGLKFGNSARHMMMAFTALPFLVSALIFSLRIKVVTSTFLLLLLLLNYFSLPINGKTVSPSTQLFASKNEIQKKVSKLHEKGREFALLNESSKVSIGSSTNPYTLFEITANASEIKFIEKPYKLSIITREGVHQLIAIRNVRRSDAIQEAETYKRKGWVVWSMEYDLSQLTESEMEEDLRNVQNNSLVAANSGFEKWDSNRPADWLLRISKDTVFKSTTAVIEGQTALALSSNSNYNYVYQDLPIDRSLSGQTIVVTAMTKTFENNKALIGTKIKSGKHWSKSVKGAPHPGDGEWHRIGVVHQIPDTFSGGVLRIVLLQKASSKICIFDDVRIYSKKK